MARRNHQPRKPRTGARRGTSYMRSLQSGRLYHSGFPKQFAFCDVHISVEPAFNGKIQMTPAAYPQSDCDAKISGVVRISLSVGKDGTVGPHFHVS